MRYGLAIGLSLVLWGTAHVGLAADKDVERMEKSAEVITDIVGTPEKGIPRDLMNKSVCVAVIPSEKKLAIGIGASYGRGVMVCRTGGNGPSGRTLNDYGGRYQRRLRDWRPSHGFRLARDERPGCGKTVA